MQPHRLHVASAKDGDDSLFTRSQAKRLLARVEKFKVVIFDFEGVKEVGQAFADQVFRVFALQYPDILLISENANADVEAMIKRALALKKQNETQPAS